jgi:hypothetical protein
MAYAEGANANVLNAVRELMRRFVYPYTTPICSSEDLVHGESHGTGTFVSLKGTPYILTNEHVPRLGLGRILSHFVGTGRRVGRIENPFIGSPPPVDVAIARIDPAALEGGDRDVAPPNFIDDRFRTATGEVMFLQGYPVAMGDFNELTSTHEAGAFSFVADLVRCRIGEGLYPEKHIAIRYPLYAYDANGEPVQLPHPEGLSGSALWDTKWAATGEADWGPQDARICGLIFGFHEDESPVLQPDAVRRSLVALRIEYVRGFLVDALRHEAAYFKSLRKNSPPEKMLSDWL